MKVLNLLYEDFTNYKKPAMFIGMGTCDFKCCKEAGIPSTVCQNYLLKNDYIDVDIQTIVGNYMSNNISESIVIGGLEPFDDYNTLLELITEFRKNTQDDIVIYTGYYPHELVLLLTELKKFNNIFIKFGRFIPNDDKHYDPVLGVMLSSNNQFALNIEDVTYQIIDNCFETC